MQSLTWDKVTYSSMKFGQNIANPNPNPYCCWDAPSEIVLQLHSQTHVSSIVQIDLKIQSSKFSGYSIKFVVKEAKKLFVIIQKDQLVREITNFLVHLQENQQKQ